jgi:hypothetical protein
MPGTILLLIRPPNKFLPGGKVGRNVQLTIHLHFATKLRTNKCLQHGR